MTTATPYSPVRIGRVLFLLPAAAPRPERAS